MYGRTALHWAAAISNTKCLTILIQYAVFQQIGVDWVDNDRMVPLQVAAQFGRSKHIAMLLKAGANAECTDIEGKTSLHWCLNNTDTDSIITLCKACPAILNARDANGATLLHWASAQGQAHIVNCLIAMEGCDLNRRDEWSCTAIHYTCLYGHSNCLQMLLAYGAHDQVTDMNGFTPLHYATQQNHLDCLHLLCSLADVTNLPDSEGHRALTWAAMLGHEQAIKILLQNSRCLQAIDVEEADQRTALHIAAFSGHLACVKLLLEQGANVESRDFYGMSPLHLASSQGHADCIGQLLSVGADANSVDNMGQTSVHVAVQGNRVACVGALLQNGALCDVRDVWHTTALQYAVSGERHECVEVLVRYGADPSLTGLDGLSTFHLAVKQGCDVALFSLLLQSNANFNVYVHADSNEQLTALDFCQLYNRNELSQVLRAAGALHFRDIEHLAATAIQSAWKGWRDRCHFQKMKGKDKAAILIQSLFRGHKERKAFRALVLQYRAASAIQSAYRLYMGRKKLQAEGVRIRSQLKANHLVRQFYNELKRQTREEEKLDMSQEELFVQERSMIDEEKERLELSLQLRDLELKRQEEDKRFRQAEMERRRAMEQEKELNHWLNILQKSKMRCKPWDQRSSDVKAGHAAATKIQQWWKRRNDKEVVDFFMNVKTGRRKWDAATIIQRAWKEWKTKEEELNKKREDEAKKQSSNLPYMRHTLISSHARRKLDKRSTPPFLRQSISAPVKTVLPPVKGRQVHRLVSAPFLTTTPIKATPERGQSSKWSVKPWTVLPVSQRYQKPVSRKMSRESDSKLPIIGASTHIVSHKKQLA